MSACVIVVGRKISLGVTIDRITIDQRQRKSRENGLGPGEMQMALETVNMGSARARLRSDSVIDCHHIKYLTRLTTLVKVVSFTVF